MKNSMRWATIFSACALGAAALFAASSDLIGGDAQIHDSAGKLAGGMAGGTTVSLPSSSTRAGGALAECAQAGGYEFACKINGWASNDMNGRYTCPLDPWDGDSGHNEIVIARSEGESFEWQAMNPVAAIIVQWSGTAKAFRYEPGATRGTRVQDAGAGQPGAITHVTFCWNRD